MQNYSISTLDNITQTSKRTTTTAPINSGSTSYDKQTSPRIAVQSQNSSITRSDALSVTSSITMESFNILQSKVVEQDKKLEQMCTIIGKIAQSVLKEDEASPPTYSKEKVHTGGRKTTGDGL